MSVLNSRSRGTRPTLALAVFGLFLGLLVVGCLGRSPEVEHFMLGKVQIEAGGGSRAHSEVAVLVGPVKLPAYLERPQIATLEENGEVELDETSRWLGGFEDNFLRSVSRGLAHDLDSIRIAVAPSSAPFSFDYRIRIHIDDFVFVSNRDRLHARIRWALSSEESDTSPALFLLETFRELEDDSTEALVEAHEAVIAELVSQIVAEIDRREASPEAGGL